VAVKEGVEARAREVAATELVPLALIFVIQDPAGPTYTTRSRICLLPEPALIEAVFAGAKVAGNQVAEPSVTNLGLQASRYVPILASAQIVSSSSRMRP